MTENIKVKEDDKIILERQIRKINLEKKILDAISPYYSKLGTFDHKIGITSLEFHNYLADYGFSELRDEFLEKVTQKINKRKKELEKIRLEKKELKKEQEEKELERYLQNRKITQGTSIENQLGISHVELGSLKQIIFIPSWNKLIQTGQEFKGFYLNQPVLEIIQDNVILLPEFMVTGFEETVGDPFIFLCGVGIYYVQFRLKPGEIIDDFREITGIVLPVSVYDKAQDLSYSLIQSQELLMTEFMTIIPFSVMLTEQTKQMYLRGVVSRNVIHPYKEAFSKLVNHFNDPNSFSEEEGLKVLCGGLSNKIPLYTNELLTEKKLIEYSKLTAGIKNIQPKLDKIISDLQIKGLRKPIFKKIGLLIEDFVNIGYPRLLDWIP